MNRLAELRAKAGLKQQDAAAMLGIDRSTIAKWETNIAFPHSSKLPMIARIYNCSISDLYAEPKSAEESK